MDKILQVSKSTLKSCLHSLKFENTAYNSLPIDKTNEKKPRQVRNAIYSEVIPTPRKNPRIISISKPALQLIGIDTEDFLKHDENHLILGGNMIPSNSHPIANCYCGYQFGVWAGQLGDGRAISFGDVLSPDGSLFDLQLKGSGLTPYSRFADGNAVLRSSIREYLCSEALWGLGIPTTRAGSLVVTDDFTDRDPLYKRQVIQEQCALVLRIAPSFIRFGSFEICHESSANRPNGGPSAGLENELIPKLWNYISKNFYSQFSESQKEIDLSNLNQEIFKEIVQRTAKTVALWQNYGFCHGVLNTDNMSILGLTIDFGPFGFMEYFDKNHICNSSDNEGRYSYKNQIQMCKWNLTKLSEALAPVIKQEVSQQIINTVYDEYYHQWYYFFALKKLGFLLDISEPPKILQKEYIQIVDHFFNVLDACGTDYTLCFNKLKNLYCEKNFQEYNFSENDQSVAQNLINISAPRQIYLKKRKPLYDFDQIEQLEILLSNPSSSLFLMQHGITAEFINKQKNMLQHYEKIRMQSEEQRLNLVKQLWLDFISVYKELNTQIIKTSQLDEKVYNIQRKEQFQKFNPRYILRNSVAQACIEKAQKGDFGLLEKVLQVLYRPFEEQFDAPIIFDQLAQNCNQEICVSCSS